MVFPFLGSFAAHFQIKLSKHGSNLNSTFVIMSELKFFLLTGVLIQNFNTMDLVKFLEKNQKLQIQIITITLKVTLSRTMRKKKGKKSGEPRFYGQNKLFLSTLSFSPWALSTTWLHVGAPLKIQEKNELNTRFEQNFTTGSYRVGIGRARCSRKACEICCSLV
jgi:hypothetical protein